MHFTYVIAAAFNQLNMIHFTKYGVYQCVVFLSELNSCVYINMYSVVIVDNDPWL